MSEMWLKVLGILFSLSSVCHKSKAGQQVAFPLRGSRKNLFPGYLLQVSHIPQIVPRITLTSASIMHFLL